MDERKPDTEQPESPKPDDVPPPRKRRWRSGAGLAAGLILAFVWGGIAYRELAPSNKSLARMIPAAAVGATAVAGSEAPPSWVNDFANAFCKGDAKTIAPRIGPPLTNNVEAIQNALTSRDWECSDIRFAGGGQNPKGTFYMFITRDGQNAEQWWVFTVTSDQVVAID